jgi:hypothetical protein
MSQEADQQDRDEYYDHHYGQDAENAADPKTSIDLARADWTADRLRWSRHQRGAAAGLEAGVLVAGATCTGALTGIA